MLLIEVAPTNDRAAALRRLEPVARHAVGGASVEDMAEGAELLDVIEAGAVVGAVALDVTGNVATIKAAASRGRETAAELELIERAAEKAGAVMLGMFTRRGALVRALARRGYRIRSVELEKDLTHGR